MGIDKKILEEIHRFKNINKYILEQEAPPTDPNMMPPADPMMAGAPADPGLPPAPGPEAPTDPNAVAPATPEPPTTGATPVDVAADADVEELDAEGNDDEKLEITDLVDAQKTIGEKQDEYFNNLFSQLSNLEQKLADMDQLVSKIDNLETKIEKMRPKTPEEKLELRSLDSGPFNQKLTDFFTDKQVDMEKSGKNDYVLTTDDVESYTKDQIEDSFYDYENNEEDTDVM